MKLIIMFDLDFDIIDVPPMVVEQKDLLRAQFLKWIYGPAGKKYRVIAKDSSGALFYGLNYRGDAFVEWLNKKFLANSTEKAAVIQQYAKVCNSDLPCIFF